jgi:hypothetical protein
MVAMTGGLFLTMVVFALSRDASRFYQGENRVANATLSGLGGFERLSGDVARAAHLSTPNIQADPHVCNKPQPGWPKMMRQLRGLLIEDGSIAASGTEVAAAGFQPKSILIAGALDMPEVLTTSGVGDPGGGFWQVSIDLAKPSARRIGLTTGPGSETKNLPLLKQFFLTPGGAGRIIRLRDRGDDQYALVQSVDVGPNAAMLNLAANPPLVRSAAGGVQCGIRGNATAMDLSVIDLVRYSIRSMTAEPTYKALFRASGNGSGGTSSAPAPFEDKRAELVRVEVDPFGQEIAETREIVAEYAVDLQFTAWRANGPANPVIEEVTTAVDENYALTQLIRGVHTRLSVRSREADRGADVPGAAATDHYRIGLNAGQAPFARVRTFQADIPLRNLENGNW